MKTLFVYSILFIFAGLIYAQTIFVSSEHWVYDYLDRLETRDVLERVHNSTRPMTRDQIADHLRDIISDSHKQEQLNRIEQDQLFYLLVEFQEELGDLEKFTAEKSRIERFLQHEKIDPWLPDVLYQNGRNFLSVQDGPLKAYWDPILYRRRLFAESDTLQNQERVFQDSNGFVLWGTLGRYIGFMTDVRDTQEWGTRAYPQNRNFTRTGLGFVQGSGEFIYHDETRAYGTVSTDHFSLLFGKDDNRWGPGYHTHLTLSDHATTYDQFRLQFHTDRVTFTQVYAWLKHYRPDFFYGNYAEKMMAAHRLEISLGSWLDLGLHEAVIFGGRSFEPGYANPFMFYRSAEHYLGDRDNATMGLDFEFKALPRSKFYGELFVDDFKASKVGTDFYGNKYAWLLGGYHADFLGIDFLDLRTEYSRVRPYTYSHKDTILAYLHYSTPLGHHLGPNAQEWFLQFEYQFTRRLSAQLGYRVSHKGRNPDSLNIGGDIYQPHNSAVDPMASALLSGHLTLQRQIFLSLDYELLRKLYLRSLVRQIRFQNEPVQKQMHRFEFYFSLGLNY